MSEICIAYNRSLSLPTEDKLELSLTLKRHIRFNDHLTWSIMDTVEFYRTFITAFLKTFVLNKLSVIRLYLSSSVYMLQTQSLLLELIRFFKVIQPIIEYNSIEVPDIRVNSIGMN